jgi:hypothetical protein
VSRICRIIKEACSDIERQFVWKYKRKKSLIFYCEVTLEWCKEQCRDFRARNESNWLAWFGTGVWKRRGIMDNERI